MTRSGGRGEITCGKNAVGEVALTAENIALLLEGDEVFCSTGQYALVLLENSLGTTEAPSVAPTHAPAAARQPAPAPAPSAARGAFRAPSFKAPRLLNSQPDDEGQEAPPPPAAPRAASQPLHPLPARATVHAAPRQQQQQAATQWRQAPAPWGQSSAAIEEPKLQTGWRVQPAAASAPPPATDNAAGSDDFLDFLNSLDQPARPFT